MKFPIDSYVQDYRDWTTRWGDRPPPEEHIIWLSSALVPFQTDPGTPFIPPDFTLGLPAVEDWPKQAGEVPRILDPAEHPKLAVQSHHESAGPSLGDKRWKRRKKKKKRHRKRELKVTTRGKVKMPPYGPASGPIPASAPIQVTAALVLTRGLNTLPVTVRKL